MNKISFIGHVVITVYYFSTYGSYNKNPKTAIRALVKKSGQSKKKCEKAFYELLIVYNDAKEYVEKNKKDYFDLNYFMYYRDEHKDFIKSNMPIENVPPKSKWKLIEKRIKEKELKFFKKYKGVSNKAIKIIIDWIFEWYYLR